MLKLAISVIAVIFICAFVFVQVHSAKDIPVEQLKPQWMTSASSFMEIDDLSLHVSDEGVKNDATPIVLIHGTGASLHTWDGWTSTLKHQRRVMRISVNPIGRFGFIRSLFFLLFHPSQFYLK